MSGISIEVELQEAEAQARLRALLDRMDRRQPFFAAVGEILVASAGRNFQAQSGPDGKAWTPLRPKTVKARTRAGQLPLTILRSNSRGKIGSSLAGSINYQASNDEVRIGSPVEYAAIHQLGGTIQKPARAAKIYRKRGEDGKIGRRFVKKSEADVVTDVEIGAHAITIPARPFLGVSAADQEDIFDAAEDWLGA